MLTGRQVFAPCGCQDVSLSHLSLFAAQLVPLPEATQEEEEEDKAAAGEEQGKGEGGGFKAGKHRFHIGLRAEL